MDVILSTNSEILKNNSFICVIGSCIVPVAVRRGSLLQPMLVKNRFCIKFNWLFLGAGVVLWNLNHYFVKLSVYLQSTVCMLRKNKN